MSLNFGFNVGVRSGHHRHPNIVKAAELLQECIHFFWATLYKMCVLQHALAYVNWII